MNELSFLDQYPFFQIIIYIIVAFGGGVIYKYYRLSLENKQINKIHDADTNQRLIENLQQRLDKMTNDLSKFEKERTEVHKRELIRERELAQAQANVKILEYKVEELSKAVRSLTDMVGKYEKKYGKLNETN